jgi:hypothetical protein
MKTSKPYIIGISSVSGGGKTTLTIELKNKLVQPPIVKPHLNVGYDFCNIPLPPESVCGIQEQNEGSPCCNNPLTN